MVKVMNRFQDMEEIQELSQYQVCDHEILIDVPNPAILRQRTALPWESGSHPASIQGVGIRSAFCTVVQNERMNYGTEVCFQAVRVIKVRRKFEVV
jgi:hypothetical protein